MVKTFFFFFFWCSREFGGKSVAFSGLHLICLPEKSCGRGSSPPMLKIGQYWAKIANYPPNAQQRFAPLPRIPA